MGLTGWPSQYCTVSEVTCPLHGTLTQFEFRIEQDQEDEGSSYGRFQIPQRTDSSGGSITVMYSVTADCTDHRQDAKYIKITINCPTWMHLRHGSDLTYDTSVYKNDGT